MQTVKVLGNKGWLAFIVSLILMYGYGVLSPQHYGLGKLDAFIGTVVTMIISIGLLVWYLTNTTTYRALSSYIWLLAIVIFLLQPLMHAYHYFDSLIFPVGVLLVAFFISQAVINFNENEKTIATNLLAMAMTITGLLLVMTQALQLFFPSLPSSFIMPNMSNRLSGNIAQPNQASFVIAMAVATFLYLIYLYEKKINNHKFYAIVIALILTIFGMGIGLSVSRAGLFLVCAALIGSYFYQWRNKNSKFAVLILASVCLSVGYWLGSELVANYLIAVSSLERMADESSLGIRATLVKQAFLAFQSSPIVGLGYESFNHFGTQHPDIALLINADNAHNVFAQIAAEFGLLGLLCLLGFVAIIIRNANRFFTSRLNGYQTLSFVILTIVGLYSLSEYPLWYARFLFLSAFFTALLDKPIKAKIVVVNKFFSIILIITIFFCGFYIKKYDDYLKVYEEVIQSDKPYNKRLEAFGELSNVFGYNKYKESLYYLLMAPDLNKINNQVKFGDNVIKAYGFDYMLEKQATLLAYAGRKNASEMLYKALCQRERTDNITQNLPSNCSKTLSAIKEVNPPNAQNYINNLIMWQKVQ